MPLADGTRLGPYEILASIGEGGMGEVYRARDTTLKREVALKVLPAAFLRDPERMARFQREAEVLASLDHPNIGPIFGLVDADESRALVLALIEGPTLADRIAAGPLPVAEAIAISKQIIEALEYAHDRGVVHRDLKPANVKITPDGVVKVLDFGLAKVLEDEPPKSSLSNSPTLTLGHTRAGMILGTAAYMSPEQAVGRPVDRRSDIFSFGAVLYEMLTGKRAFEGAATPDVLEAVVKNDPDWSKLPACEALVRRCLTKDRKQRLQAIGEARIALNRDREGADRPDQSPPSQSRLSWAAAALLALTTALALWSPWSVDKPIDRPLARLEVDLGADVSLLPIGVSSGVAISPDGTRLAYSSGRPPKLFTRRLDQLKATELPGTEGAGAPFFSPDGQWIGFIVRNTINKISVDGGAIVPLGDGRNFAGASWSEDGSIFVGYAFNKGLVRIPPDGGPPETIIKPDNELVLSFPQILPGGKAVLFTVYTVLDADKASIEVLTLSDHRRKVVARGGTSARYLATSNGSGHLVYTNKATLFAIPFDLDKLETRGSAVPILDDVAYDTQSGGVNLNSSRAGTLVYRRGSPSEVATATLQWVDPTGKREPLRAKPGVYGSPSISPDGKRVALLVTDGGNQDVWVYDPQRDAMTRLTFGGSFHTPAVWSPDGQRVVFGSVGNAILWTRADGASQPQAWLPGKIVQVPWSFTADGKRLTYIEFSGTAQIWTVPLEDRDGQWKAGNPEQFLKSNSLDQTPAFSPDGRWLAYDSNESGRNEVYVRAFPPPSSGQGGKWQISNSGGVVPRWSRNGRELVYWFRDQVMAVSYTSKGDSFLADKPRLWIAKLGGGRTGATQWDLAPDGKRVAVVTPVESGEPPKPEHSVMFLENFFDELRRRAPLAK